MQNAVGAAIAALIAHPSHTYRVAPAPIMISHDPPAVSATHALSNLSSIGALLKVAVSTPFKGTPGPEAISQIVTPGPLVEVELPATPQVLHGFDYLAPLRSGS